MAVTRSSSAKKVVRKAVAVKVTKSSGGRRVSWDDCYNQLFALREKEGHCCPLWSTTLGKWCNNQRAKFQATFQDSNRVLYQYQIEKLSKLGFQFCLRNKKLKKILKWDDRYDELVVYKNKHGHANPLQREGQLGTWCDNQRKLFQNNMNKVSKNWLIHQHQIKKLVVISFLFKPTTGQAYAAMRQLAGQTGLAGLDRHASLTGYAYFSGHAKFSVLGDLARLRTSGT